MYKQLIVIAAIVVGVVAVAPQANAASTMDEALKRMDAIIIEMQALRAEFAALSVETVTAPQGSVLGSVSGGVLGDDLRFGSTNNDIKKIQTLLATDPSIYPYGVASGYFGPKTQEAVRLFQSRFDLDTVGVVGPSTRALLEVFFAAYPEGDYPTDVLQQPKPVVTPTVAVQTPVVAPAVVTGGLLRSLSISAEDDEYIVRSYKKDGKRNRDLILYPEDKEELIKMIARKLGVSQTEVESLIDEDDLEFNSKKSSKNDADAGDAKDAIDDADDALDDARDAIKEAKNDGDDVDDADELYDEGRALYRKAKSAYADEEYDDAVEFAQEAQELGEDAHDEV